MDRLHELLERLGSLLRAGDRRRGDRQGPLQPVHWQVLHYLARCNRFSDTPAAVAAFLGAGRGTVSQSILVLARRGLVARAADADDGRVVHLRLTARGRRLAEGRPGPAFERAAQTLPPADRAGAERALEALLTSLQRANGGRTFGVCGSCRHLQGGPRGPFRCGLNGEPLAAPETAQICHHHALPPAAPLG